LRALVASLINDTQNGVGLAIRCLIINDTMGFMLMALWL
jgi:hypothetical protein